MQKGFLNVLVGVIVAAILIIGAGGYVYVSKEKSTSESTSSKSDEIIVEQEKLNLEITNEKSEVIPISPTVSPASETKKDEEPLIKQVEKKVDESDSFSEDFKSINREINALLDLGGTIGPLHYRELEGRLDSLENKGAEKTDIDSLRASLLTLSPFEEEQQPVNVSEDSDQVTSVTTTTEPTPLSWILPFEVDEISYAGAFVIIPFGDDLGGGALTPDVFFEVEPGTILQASTAGKVSVNRNPIGTTPHGEVYDPKDWELLIQIGDGPYWIEYDHVVDVLVSDGDFVEIGQPLARAAPAAIRHSGPQGELPIDEFEWGLRKGGMTAIGVCPLSYLTVAEQAKLQSFLDNMRLQGFASLESVCLSEETPG